ncbi:hypothetical protein H4S02_003341 [Coemansia sp. RSA 2611]|nr:hypothetical protein H4S02_003341 [Coemansia sp. RSA 2611]
MSGKGRAPRVKGNLKPTSSSRAADLVGDDTAAINAFKANPALAFSQLSRAAKPKSGSSTPKQQTSAATSGASTPQIAGLDQIDGHLAAQLKRLGKHDATTKMRALFELKSYIDEHTWDTGLEGMMLAWPPLFKRYVFDPDRRVRASVAQVHADLVTKIGRRLAAQLKLVVGPWMASYFDPHRDVARTSRLAFETVFSEAKRKEVFAFCVGDLLEFATDNIVNQTAETMSDPRFVGAEEMRSKYEHIVGASFGVLGLVVDEVGTETLLRHRGEFDAVLESKQALGLLASPSSFVRRNIYRLIRAIMLKCPELAADSHTVVARALLKHCFSDSDPNGHGDMWDAVLLTTKNYPQVWLAESGKKGAPIDRVFEFLRTRCRLSPTISYPSILALLANLPAEIVDSPQFQQSFDTALWQGVSDAAESTRAAHRESVALVTAICECSSFLWTRTLKSTTDAKVIAAVGKEVAKRVDQLWHYYLQHRDSAEEMAGPIVKLYCKIDSLAAKHDHELLARIWAQTSWFALQRLTGSAIAPIVSLTVQIAELDASVHKELADGGRKLLVAFCQLATQSPDGEVARALIQALSSQAPEVVFQEGFAEKFSQRLEQAGSADDAVQLVLSKAQHVAQATGDINQAAKSIDAYVAGLLKEGESKAFGTAAELLFALPESEIAQTSGWDSAQLPSTGAALPELLPTLSGGDRPIALLAADVPLVPLIRLYKQALVLHFMGTELFARTVVDQVFAWMEQVFMRVYHAQLARDTDDTALEAWSKSAHEVLSVWITLARDEHTGARFVRYWLERSGNHGRSALGLLFDLAVSSADADAANEARPLASKLAQQARRAWSATEAQIEKLRLGARLARALSESIMQDVDDLALAKSPVHLARLASSVYTRICPQDDERALQMLIGDWLLDEQRYEQLVGSETERFAAAACVAGGSGLWQAVDDCTDAQTAQSFHTLTHWLAASGAQQHAAAPAEEFDQTGMSRFARHAVFSIEFVRLSGGTPVLSGASQPQLIRFMLQMTLAFVLLREALLLASSSAEWCADADDRTGNRMVARVSMVSADLAEAKVLAQADAAAREIQEVVSELLSLTVVHDLSLPSRTDTGSVKIAPPRDPGRWLAVLIETMQGTNDAASTVWSSVVTRCRQSAGSPWVLVLGRLVEWCAWASSLDSATVETGLADALSRQLAERQLASVASVGVATVVARAVSLRQLCSQAPALRSALLDSTARAARIAEGGSALELVAELELLAELLPVHEAALDAEASAAKITRVLLALPAQLQSRPNEDVIVVVLAALTVLQRLCACAPELEPQGAVELAQLCLRWTETPVAPRAEPILLMAVSHALSALARARGADDAVAVPLRLAGERLVERCVLSERPVAAGVQAAAVLAERGLVVVPAFSALYPVLASATPRLNSALTRLVLAEPDHVAYISDGLEALARLAASAAKRLADLSVPHATLGEVAESDEFVRGAGVRLLTALLLIARFAASLAESGAYEDLVAQLQQQRVLDAAMPWACGLLGLAGGRKFDARLWEVTKLDWASWSYEAEHSPAAEQVLGVLAFHIMRSLAASLPAALRTWWAGLPPAQRAMGAAVERFVSTHVSSEVVGVEMARIREPREDGVLARVLEEYDDAQVRAAAWQATILYTVDDSELELSVKLPPAYPLLPASFEAVRRVAVSEKRWRAWMVAAQAKLARCPRIDAVCAQVVGNIGAHFAGVEDCAICYSAVGAMDNSLPNRQCKTCKNKFHRMCLFKWFSTSNQSTCPLCRNLF